MSESASGEVLARWLDPCFGHALAGLLPDYQEVQAALTLAEMASRCLILPIDFCFSLDARDLLPSRRRQQRQLWLARHASKVATRRLPHPGRLARRVRRELFLETLKHAGRRLGGELTQAHVNAIVIGVLRRNGFDL
jgi:hypothetical protein